MALIHFSCCTASLKQVGSLWLVHKWISCIKCLCLTHTTYMYRLFCSLLWVYLSDIVWQPSRCLVSSSGSSILRPECWFFPLLSFIILFRLRLFQVSSQFIFCPWHFFSWLLLMPLIELRFICHWNLFCVRHLNWHRFKVLIPAIFVAWKDSFMEFHISGVSSLWFSKFSSLYPLWLLEYPKKIQRTALYPNFSFNLSGVREVY